MGSLVAKPVHGILKALPPLVGGQLGGIRGVVPSLVVPRERQELPRRYPLAHMGLYGDGGRDAGALPRRAVAPLGHAAPCLAYGLELVESAQAEVIV